MEQLEARLCLAVPGPGGGPVPVPNPINVVTMTASHPILEEDLDADRPMSVTFTVHRDGELDQALTVQIQAPTGTATKGADYTSPPTSVTFGVNEFSKSFVVEVIDDAIAEPAKQGEPDETFSLALVRRQDRTAWTDDTPIKITINDGSQFYYLGWSLRLGPDRLRTDSVSEAVSEYVWSSPEDPNNVPGGIPVNYFRRIEYLYYYDEWVPKYGDTSDYWMSKMDGDAIDDNDVSFTYGADERTQHSFSFGLGASMPPLNVTLFNYQYTTVGGQFASQTFAAGADDDTKVRVVAFVKQRVYYVQAFEFSQTDADYDGVDADKWEHQGTTEYEKGRGSPGLPEMLRAVFEIKRFWLDPDDARVPNLFPPSQSKEDDKPEDYWWK